MNKYFALRKANRMRTKLLNEKKPGAAERCDPVSSPGQLGFLRH